MNRKLRPFAGLAAVVTCLAGGAAAQSEHPPAATHPATGVVRSISDGATAVVASVPGPILDWQSLVDGDTRHLMLLVAPEESDHHRLYDFDPIAETLELLDAAIESRIDRLHALDLDGDGDLELLAGEPGAIYEVQPGTDATTLSLLARAPGLDLAAALAAGDHRLELATVGRLHRYGPTADGFASLGALALPVSAARFGTGLRRTSPPSARITGEAGPLVAIGPQAHGTRRLRSQLLGADDSRREIWARLPEPSRLQHSWFSTLDGRPVLIVTTNSADKVGALERQTLHLFSLYGDVTRSGVGPWLSFQTASRRWQRVEPVITDLDGDGDEDLLVLQGDGLGGGKTRVEAYVNHGRRGFESRSRVTNLELPTQGWHFASDLDGDGLGDLVLASDGALLVFPVLDASSKRVVERRPRWNFDGADIPRPSTSVTLGPGGVVVDHERPSAVGRPGTLDFDGDGRDELVLAENPEWGFGRVRVHFLPTARR